MKNGGNGLERVAILKLLREWMFGQYYYARLYFIVLHSSLEEDL